MSEELPSGDKAVFAFFELFALAFAFEGAGALLRGEPWWRIVLAWARKQAPKGIPKDQIGVPIPVWNEIVLLPKGSRTADIHRLSDIPRYGGVVLSRELPK